MQPELAKPKQWEIESLYRATLECDPRERAGFLARACGSDGALRRAIESLLASEVREGPGRAGPMQGRQLGSYQLISLLGAGGMGEVYRARDPRLGREVAVKVLPERLTGDPEALARFQREAKAVAALSHPNILTIYDVGADQGVSFAVMELLDGETLRSRLQRGVLPWKEAVEIAAAVSDGLSAAHAKRIIHRDIKPENIFLTGSGQVKLLDFGIAQVRPSASLQSVTTAPTATLTEVAMPIGTLGYMSPEQLRGGGVEAPADLFSLGCVLYEMLTGRGPFARPTPQETAAAVLRDSPPELAESGIPVSLQQLSLHCLEKRPEQRFQSAPDLSFDLRSILAGNRSAARKRGKHWLAAATLLCAVPIGIGSIWYLRGGKSLPRLLSAPVPFTSYPGHEVQPSFSPDGNQVVFVWNGDRGDNPDLYVKLIGGAEKPLRLTSDPAPDLSPAWSPDGRFIAFVRDGPDPLRKSSVLLVPAIGGPERLVTELGAHLIPPASLSMTSRRIVPFPLLAWAPDGKHLIIADRSSPAEALGLYVVSLETGEKRRLTPAPARGVGDAAPAISPDGRTLIFSRASGLIVSELYRLALTSGLSADGEPQRLTSTQAWNTTPVWLPGGREFIFSSGSWHNGPFSLWRMSAFSGGVPQKIEALGQNITWPSISRQGDRLVFSRLTSDTNIWRVPLRNDTIAGTPEKLIASTRDDSVPQYSPDAKRIVFTSDRSGVHEVWVSDSDGSNPVQLTFFGAGMTGSPHWSPDGSKIVFDCNVEGQFEIYTIGSAGGHPRRLTYDRADDALATFSPDGRFIYFTSKRTGSWQVWRMLADGQEPVQITRALGRAPTVSRDGKRIWFEKPGLGEFWSMPLDGGEGTQLLKSVGFLNTAINDRGIYFVPKCSGVRCPSIEFFSFATRTVTPVMTVGNTLTEGLSISPDRRFLLYTQVDQSDSDLMLIEKFR